MKDVSIKVVDKEEFDDFYQITERLICGKLKWFPTLISQRKDFYREKGFQLIEEEDRKFWCLTNFRYGILLVFRKPK